MSTPVLPPVFGDLERFTETWCLATEQERYAQRLSSTMPELIEFYDAFFPRLEEAINYCDKFPLDELPEDAIALLRLIYSLVTVSMAVEIFQQPKAVDSADAEMDRIKEPYP